MSRRLALLLFGARLAHAAYPLPFRFDATNPVFQRHELTETMAQASATGDRLSEAHAQAAVALLDELDHQPESAESAMRNAAVLATAAADVDFPANAALWLAQQPRLSRVLPGRAQHWARNAAERFRTAGDTRHLAQALRILALQTVEGPTRRQLLDQALAAAEAAGDAPEAARLQSARGHSLIRAGDLRGGIGTLRAATTRLEELGEVPEAGRAYLALARGYFLHGQDTPAMAALQRGEALLKKAGDTAGMMTALQETGTFLAASGHPREAATVLAEAQRYAESPDAPLGARLRLAGVALGYLGLADHSKAAAIAQKVLDDFPRRAPLATYWILSAAYFRLQRYTESLDAATQGLSRAEDPQAITTLLAHYWRARALDRLGKPAEAATDILAAIRAEDGVRANLMPDDQWKRAFGDMLEPMAGNAVEILFRAGRYADALTVAEKSRARAFVDLLATRQSGAAASKWSSTAFVTPPSAEQLMQFAARSGETLAAYWVQPQAVYIWLVTAQGKLRATRNAIAETRLRQLVKRARTFSQKADREAWRELDRLLVQPLRAWLPPPDGRQLNILPHGELQQIPFAALLDGAGRYLVEQYSLRTIPAATLLIAPPKGLGPGGLAVLVGAPASPPADRAGKQLAPLPGALREVELIAAFWPAARRLALTGPDASAQRIRASAAGARALHFATHAVVDDSRPFETFLALGQRTKLTASDIYDLRLNADLVTLSACRSGSGQVSADGLLGLTRAFLHAGAASVVAPLWDIADEPTVRLVASFYRHYRAGQPKSRALRAAQFALLQDLRQGKVSINTPAGPLTLPEHPALWAGFVLQGGG